MNDEAKFPIRRKLLLAAGLAGLAAKAGPTASPWPQGDFLDKLQVAELVQRERGARDAGQWAEMAACWQPSATVDVSWYAGDGAGFIAASRRNAASGRISVHQLAQTIVKVAGQRAIAETPCELISFVSVDGKEVCLTGVVRLLWSAEKREGRWLIAGLRMIYVRDYLVPTDPTDVPHIDRKELATYRPSYRFLSYVLARSPNPPRMDLPGIDRAETAEAVRTLQERWLSRS